MPSTGGTRDSMFDLQPLLDAWWAKGTVPPMIIATPTSGLDYYMEDPAGSIRWDSFLAGDFVPHLRSTCDISDSTVIAGISGGGHGALKLAFSAPTSSRPSPPCSPCLSRASAKLMSAVRQAHRSSPQTPMRASAYMR
jgi:enterochelin esterase-like enzyme